jgi:hypothetical protein
LRDVALLRLYPEEETMNFDNLSPILLRSIVPLRRPKPRKSKDGGKRPNRADKLDTSVEEITNLSAETVERNYRDRIRYLSDRRKGMQLGDALAIAAGK